MKYLIVGLGNIGEEYKNTRHNIGFMILDALTKASNIFFTLDRHAYTTTLKYKGRVIVLIKPTTFMNVSGKAVNYWLKKENIPLENLLVITDDIALPLGTLRLRPKGGDGGHNGLNDIVETLGNTNFARLRFGIGDDFSKGKQVNYVLGEFSEGEKSVVNLKTDVAIEIIKSFVTIGIVKTMTLYNNK